MPTDMDHLEGLVEWIVSGVIIIQTLEDRGYQKKKTRL